MGQSVLTYPEMTVWVIYTGCWGLSENQGSHNKVILVIILYCLTLHPEFICVYPISRSWPISSVCDCWDTPKIVLWPVHRVQPCELSSASTEHENTGSERNESYFPFKRNFKRLHGQDVSRVSCCLRGNSLGDRWESKTRPISKSTVFSNPWKWMLPLFSIIHPSSILSCITADCRHYFFLAVFNPYKNLPNPYKNLPCVY